MPAGDLLLTSTGNAMVALEVATCDIRWSWSANAPQRPAVIGDVVLVTAGKKLYALEASNGAARWRQSADESTDELWGEPAGTGSVVCC